MYYVASQGNPNHHYVLFFVVVHGLMCTGNAYFCYFTMSIDRSLKDISPKYYYFHLSLHSLSLKSFFYFIPYNFNECVFTRTVDYCVMCDVLCDDLEVVTVRLDGVFVCVFSWHPS